MGPGGHVARASRSLTAASRSSRERYAALVTALDPAGIERLCRPDFLAEAGGSQVAWDTVLEPPV